MGLGGWSEVDFVIFDDLGEVVDGVRVHLAFQGLEVAKLVPDRLGAVVLVVAPASSILGG